MFEFIRIQFELGRVNEEKVRSYVPRFITQRQAEEILVGKGEKND